jgi:hypothetical protein
MGLRSYSTVKKCFRFLKRSAGFAHEWRCGTEQLYSPWRNNIQRTNGHQRVPASIHRPAKWLGELSHRAQEVIETVEIERLRTVGEGAVGLGVDFDQ